MEKRRKIPSITELGRALVVSAGIAFLNHPPPVWAQEITSGMTSSEARKELRRQARELSIETLAVEVWAVGPRGKRRFFVVPPGSVRHVTAVFYKHENVLPEIRRHLLPDERIAKVRIAHTHTKAGALANCESYGVTTSTCKRIRSSPPSYADTPFQLPVSDIDAEHYRKEFGLSVAVEHAVIDQSGEWVFRHLTKADEDTWPELSRIMYLHRLHDTGARDIMDLRSELKAIFNVKRRLRPVLLHSTLLSFFDGDGNATTHDVLSNSEITTGNIAAWLTVAGMPVEEVHRRTIIAAQKTSFEEKIKALCLNATGIDRAALLGSLRKHFDRMYAFPDTDNPFGNHEDSERLQALVQLHGIEKKLERLRSLIQDMPHTAAARKQVRESYRQREQLRTKWILASTKYTSGRELMAAEAELHSLLRLAFALQGFWLEYHPFEN